MFLFFYKSRRIVCPWMFIAFVAGKQVNIKIEIKILKFFSQLFHYCFLRANMVLNAILIEYSIFVFSVKAMFAHV